MVYTKYSSQLTDLSAAFDTIDREKLIRTLDA